MMRKILFAGLISAILISVISCQPKESNSNKISSVKNISQLIPETNLMIELPITGERYNVTEKNSEAFKKGMTFSYMSMNANQFAEAQNQGQMQKYFAISAFKPVRWEKTFSEWYRTFCSIKEIRLERQEYVPQEDFWLYQFETWCTPIRNLVIFHNHTIYRFDITDDTYNLDAVWNILKNANFINKT